MNKLIIIAFLILFIFIVLRKKKSSFNRVLPQLLNNNKSDKNTRHSYLELYENLLQDKKISAKNVLEIGIDRGGSIKMWDDYFDNAIIYGVDIMKDKDVWNELRNKDSIKLYTLSDAYSVYFINKNFNNIKFDFILDDGPHTLESMILCLQLYLPLLTYDGILIIEDVQEIEWFDTLKEYVPNNLKSCIKTHDLRSNKDRYDDLVFVVDKRLLI